MIILVGASASGKTEVAKVLTTKYGFKKFVTSTTREPRVNEVNGIDYNFLTEDTFIKMKNNNEFIETTFYNNNYYGTEKKLIDDQTVLVVESNGLIAFKLSSYPNIISYFLNADELTRIERMRLRGDKEEDIHQRIYHDRFKFNTTLNKYIDVFIDEKEKSAEEIADLIYLDYKEKLK